jgi:hypothetical protein
MAYQFELETDFDSAPFCDNLGTQIVEFGLGYDIDQNHIILMSVMFVPAGAVWKPEATGVYDLRFGIRERDADLEWKISGPDYTRDAVRKYVPKQHREAVRLDLLKAVSYLVDSVVPAGVTMESYYPNLDSAALRKYSGICQLICEKGYEIVDDFCDGTSGINYWFLKRTS